MAIDIRPYGRLPVLAIWCFWGTCFYSFLTYQMYGERGRRNRKKIGVFLGLAPPEVTPEEEEWKAILDKTTYSNMDSNKQHIKDR
ncbi:hypothetical protein P5673_027976 [Acropora cervicornis]|uniref:Uncharacterized protein n=1 Tax=Acropora cervicornis TaxID=6130 RepID=A0AAD9PXZ4_ACRCE|nr:hypothetical protein P5673_027976 [Acropora cervicornis]